MMEHGFLCASDIFHQNNVCENPPCGCWWNLVCSFELPSSIPLSGQLPSFAYPANGGDLVCFQPFLLEIKGL
jgi:hypothetical protein